MGVPVTTSTEMNSCGHKQQVTSEFTHNNDGLQPRTGQTQHRQRCFPVSGCCKLQHQWPYPVTKLEALVGLSCPHQRGHLGNAHSKHCLFTWIQCVCHLNRSTIAQCVNTQRNVNSVTRGACGQRSASPPASLRDRDLFPTPCLKHERGFHRRHAVKTELDSSLCFLSFL